MSSKHFEPPFPIPRLSIPLDWLDHSLGPQLLIQLCSLDHGQGGDRPGEQGDVLCGVEVGKAVCRNEPHFCMELAVASFCHVCHCRGSL